MNNRHRQHCPDHVGWATSDWCMNDGRMDEQGVVCMRVKVVNMSIHRSHHTCLFYSMQLCNTWPVRGPLPNPSINNGHWQCRPDHLGWAEALFLLINLINTRPVPHQPGHLWQTCVRWKKPNKIGPATLYTLGEANLVKGINFSLAANLCITLFSSLAYTFTLIIHSMSSLEYITVHLWKGAATLIPSSLLIGYGSRVCWPICLSADVWIKGESVCQPMSASVAVISLRYN